MKKRLLATLLCVMMVLTLLPATATAATVTPKYVNFDASTTILPLGDFSVTDTIAVFINGVSGDTYTTTESENGKLLLINNVDVTVDEAGVPSEFRISGSGSLNMGTFTVGAGNCTAAFTGDAADVNEVFAFYQSDTYSGEMPTAVYDYTVTGDTEIQDFLTAYDLTINTGKTLTINAPPETPDDDTDPEHYRLTVLHSLTVNGTLTVAEGQELEIRENAAVSGNISLYDTDGTTTYTFETSHNSENFVYTGDKWVRQEPNQGPAIPEDGMFTIDWDDGTPESGTSAVMKYTIEGGTEVTPAGRASAADVEIDAGKDLAITYTPQKDGENNAIDFWGFRVTKRGDPNNIINDVPKDEPDNNGVYTFSVTREAADNAGFLVEVLDNDPSQGGEGGDNPPLTAPTVSFCVQNTDTATGTVQYKINDGEWTDLILSLEGESPSQHLAGTVSASLATNDVIHIKATPGDNYEMDTTRGVNVWSDGTDSPVADGTTSIVSTDGLSYTLSENKAYEFEFGFSESSGGGGEGGGGDPGPGPGTPAHTITASAGSNGSITPSGAQTVDEGQGRQFTFQPAIGYEVDEVLVDGEPVSVTAPEYEFQNVTADHTISVSFKQITGAVGDAATAKEKIEGRRWGYGGMNATEVKAAFAAELWDMAVHEFSGVFENEAAVADAITLSNETYTVSSEFYQASETLCPYYTFTVELGENDASGKIYVLDNTTDYVVVTNGGLTPGNFTIVSGQEATVNKDYDTIGVFGNGAAIEGQLGSGENYAAFHVATRAGLGADAFRLTVYKTSFIGSTVTISDSYKAAAWGFAQAKIAEFGSSPAVPTEFEVYFGNSSVRLSASGLSDVGIQALFDVTAPSLPDGAVTITENVGDGNAKTFTITFNSNFYDEVPLTITYTDKAGGNSTAYLTLKRVGIDIQAYQKTGDSNGSYNTNHGTDPGLQNQSWGADDYAVYASYYYPTGNTPDYSVNLYATYTWANGSVTREIIASTAQAEGNENSVPIDDFLLYKGPESDAPAKIEVTAIKTGGAGAVFAGATLGSGAGVEWRYVHREPPMQPPVD